MMDEFIHWPKPTFFCHQLSDEISSWMIEIWMKNHLVSDSNCNTVNIFSLKKLQGMTYNIGLTLSVSDTVPQFTISTEQVN